MILYIVGVHKDVLLECVCMYSVGNIQMRAVRAQPVVRAIKYHRRCANHRATATLVERAGPVEENYMCCEFVHTHILMNWNLSFFCSAFLYAGSLELT